MRIIYSNHAEEKIKERELSKKTIETAISCPDKIIESQSGRKIIHKIINKKLLRVVIEEKNDLFIVVTAYYTKPERYR
ncbi:MAG: DUF4258 domain-containing protein [Candidatus Aenigmatarchaeota archaeon]